MNKKRFSKGWNNGCNDCYRLPLIEKMEAVTIKSNKKRKIDDVNDGISNQVSKSSLKNGSEKASNASKEQGNKKKVKIVVPGDSEDQSGAVNPAAKRQKKQPKEDKSPSTEVNGEENGEDGKPQLNNKQLKKLKQKRKKQKKKKGLKKLQEIQEQKNEEGTTSSVEKNDRHRDFATDLTEYLSRWRQHQLSGTASTSSEPIWKFNKVLQEWALQHCLDKQYVSSDLFKNLIPYILTVQGKAKNRFMTKLEEINNQEGPQEPQTDNDDSNADTEALLLSIAKKRASRLLKLVANLKD